MKKKRLFTQLTLSQRRRIDEFLLYGYKQSEIARKLGVHRSTIKREIDRNSPTGKYYPLKADKLCRKRKSTAEKHTKLTRFMWDTIKELIIEDWSPQQISEWCRLSKIKMVSHETIYKYLLKDQKKGGILYTHLRHSGKRRKKYGRDRVANIKNKKPISNRPDIVEKKERVGDFEVDTMLGAKQVGALVTLVDRRSKFSLIKQIENKTAKNVKDAIIELLTPFKNTIFTITSDNGSEFTLHEDIAQELECDFYFADPYSAWQRGLNENTNGLIRQYFPKGIPLTNIQDYEVKEVMKKLNNRPRKALNYETPEAIFFR